MELLKYCSTGLSEAWCSGDIDTDTDRREEGTKGQRTNSVVDIRDRTGNKQTPGRWRRGRGGIGTMQVYAL